MFKQLIPFLTLWMLMACSSSQFSIHQLNVEYQTAPIGLDESVPRFSWQMQANLAQRGLKGVLERHQGDRSCLREQGLLAGVG